MTISLYGVSTNPVDNGSNVVNPTVITPPASMQAGDLVVVLAQSRAASGTLAVSQAGGQAWTSLTQHNVTTCRRRIFWCIFNGSWSANPSITIGTTCNSAFMLVFRGTAAKWNIIADQVVANATVAAPVSPYTITIAGRTIGANAVAIAMWNVIAANTFASLAGAGWSKTGLAAQYRNTSGSDQSASFAYWLGQGATGSVSQNESAGTAGASSILSFKELAPAAGNLSLSLGDITSLLTGVSDIGGICNQTLDSLTLEAQGVVVQSSGISGELNLIVDSLDKLLAGNALVQGLGVLSIANLELSANGEIQVAGSVNIGLNDFGLATAGTIATQGISIIDLDGFGLMATGQVSIAGSFEKDLDIFSVDFSGANLASGVADITLSGMILEAGGAIINAGMVITDVNPFDLLASGLVTESSGNSGALVMSLDDLVIDATGQVPIIGTTGTLDMTMLIFGMVITASRYIPIPYFTTYQDLRSWACGYKNDFVLINRLQYKAEKRRLQYTR
jgi:hypothetical protein